MMSKMRMRMSIGAILLTFFSDLLVDEGDRGEEGNEVMMLGGFVLRRRRGGGGDNGWVIKGLV